MNRRNWLRHAAVTLMVGQLPRSAAAAAQDPNLVQAAANGRRFLAGLFDDTLDLLPEYSGAKVYWLYHDNYLAAKVLEKSHAERSKRIQTAIKSYGVTTSGKIEIVFGEASKPLPFRHPELIEVKRVGNKIIKTEILTDQELKGWEEYADLLLLASCALSGTQSTAAKMRFEQALAMWDGKGLKDRVTVKTGKYAVYKLGLALLAAHRLRVRPDLVDSIIARLLAQQSAGGGWITDYGADGKPVGLANVETTSLAVLALDAFGS